MLVRAPYTLSFIFAVCCWFRHNAAIPLASHSSSQMQDAFREQLHSETDSQSSWDDTTSKSRSTRKAETSDAASDEDSDETIQNALSNKNVNMNMNIFGRGDRRRFTRNRDERHKQSTREKTIPGHGKLEEIAREVESTNCASGNKKNQRYSSSFSGNTTERSLTVDKEFHEVVGNNSKVKKSSSVHEDEDITLCWIETTTIKEDKTTRPPKRLVIREYTISFENSATIPERYLECKKFEGELAANDPDIGKTALFEVIDEDTMVSRIVNFTSVSHVGSIIVWEHRKVKCGVGPVVSKNIIELNDGSENPKKRVEIKVSPKMHQLTATKPEEETEEPCTETSEETSTPTESTTEHSAGLSCENAESGICEPTTGSASILPKHDNEVNTIEEMVIESQSTISGESGSEENLSTRVTKSLTLPDEEKFRRSTAFPKTPTTIQKFQEKIDCEENSSDPTCLMHKDGMSTLEELSSELLSTMEATTTEAAMSQAATTTAIDIKTTEISDKKIITEKEISSEEKLEEGTTESSSTSGGEKEVTTDLVIEETTPTADIFMESSEAYKSQPTDEASVEDASATTLETEITTSATKDTEERSKPEEGSGDSFVELTSEELDKLDHVLPSSAHTMASGEVSTEQDVTAVTSSLEFAEFMNKSNYPGKILDKLSGPSVSTESVTESISTESSSKEVFSEESEESVTSAIEWVTIVEQKPTEEEEFISTVRTTTSPTEIRSTTLSPAISSEDTSCENSEDCAYSTSSEACEESGSCGETTTKSCDSEVCSEEEVIEDRSETDATPPPMKIQSSATDSESSEESAIGTQHTTVANVPTTMLTSQEGENNSTVVNVPITIDSRRSTTTSTPQHKLTLKVKVLLEHINENKEKQNLVEVEKHLALDENPEHHDNPDLFEQLKSLNESVNMETINALLNCTSLGNLTRDPYFVSNEPGDAVDGNDERLEFSDSEDPTSEQFTSGYIDTKNEDSEYDQEHEVSSRRRRRRSLDDEMEDLNGLDNVKQYLHDPTDSVVDSINISKSQHDHLMKDNIQLSTTTNNPEETTNDTDIYTENERNVTKQEDESTMPSTRMSTINDIDFSNVTESHDVNLTTEDIQSTTTTNRPEEETSIAIDIENENNVTNERNESAVPSAKETISNETKMEVARKTLPGIQEDVLLGLQHMVSQLTQNHLSAVNNITDTVKTDLLDIIADPTDDRVHSRRRRAATEEVGHWSNERIKEAPMGGNLRSLTEFTLYKVLL